MAKRSVSKRSSSASSAPSADQLAGAAGRAGIEGTPTGGFDSYGISGLTRYGPISRIYEEFLKELQGPQGMKSYREMQDNCAIVGAILFAAQHLCRKVSFTFKPANDTNEAKRVADFVGSAVFDDMEQTWPDTVSEMLSMLTFGWAVMEFRMKKRMGMGSIDLNPTSERNAISATGTGTKVPAFAPSRFDDGRVGFRSWQLRSQETLFMWEFDQDSNATHMQQMAPPDYAIRRIPLIKTLHFRTQVSKNNPEGRSMLRNAWVSYYMKKNLQIFEGIGVERDLAGYPLIQMVPPDPSKGQYPPDIWNPKDPDMVTMLNTLKKIVRSVRRDEQEGMVMPWWAEFKLISTGSRRRSETNDIIGRYDQRIAMSMMADFIMLGHEAVGSKALAATKISLFTAALSSFLDTMGAIIDRRATPMLLAFNGIPMELAPTLEHGDVESVNIEELGTFIQKVAGTGFNPLAGVDAQKAVMEAAKLPTTGVTGELTLPVAGVGAPGTEGGINDNDTKPKPGAKPAGGDPKDDKTGDNKENYDGRGGPVMPQETTTGTPDILTIKSGNTEGRRRWIGAKGR